MSSLLTSNFLFLLLFGYLFGSISPGYFLGKIVKGIDVRNYGSGLTGATNTYRVVGPTYGIIAGIIDALKAVFVYYIAVSGKIFNFEVLSPDLALIIGLAAVLGHNHPFYLGFRGGKGAASLFGLAAIVLPYTRSIFSLMLFIGSVIYSTFISEEQVFTAPKGRIFLKLSALILPLGFIWFPREILVFLVTILLSFFLAFDVFRLAMPKLNRWYLDLKKFSKTKEMKRFSGYTLFLFSAFLLFRFFPKEIAVISLTNFILGDIFAPASHIRHFPHQKILGDKTFGGFIVVFGVCFIAGIFLESLTLLPLSLKFIISAAFLTSFLDLLSFFVDDNLMVPLGTAIGLTLLI